MNTEDLITRAKIQIQNKNSFFAYLSLFLKFKESKNLPDEAGMGVDSKGNCLYKKEFVESITQGNNTKELEGVIIHEILHLDRKSTRLNSSHIPLSRMPSSA